MTIEAPSPPGTSIHQFLLRLGEASGAGPSVVGSKAANLADLIQAGFPVPDGVVLTVKAFARFMEANQITDPGKLPETPVLPDDLQAVVGVIADEFGNTPLAVRSSASDEDLPDASYAGQYDTVLDVRGEDALERAIVQCWMSAFNDRVVSYRQQQGEHSVPHVAVLIQPLIPAEAAGVAFTMNPVTGNRDETAVSAVRGLGERLVSGTASPDEWIVTSGNAIALRTPESALTADQVRQIADLARQVQTHYGTPQDIEWAISGEELALLQARSITTLDMIEPIEPVIDIPDGFWRRDAGHYPRPMSPVSSSFYLAELGEALTDGLRQFGALVERVEARSIGGYAYLRLVPPGGKDGPPPPWWILGAVVRLLPSAREMARRASDARARDLGSQLIDKWWNQWRGELYESIATFQRVDLSELSDDQLLNQLEERMTLLRDGNRIHFQLVVPFMIGVAEFAIFCREQLRWTPRQAMELLSGLSTMSTEPGRELAKLAGLAEENPEVAALLSRDRLPTVSDLQNHAPEFAEEFAAYQQRFGPRSLGEDLMEPTLGEHPEITLGLLGGQIGQRYDAERVTVILDRTRTELLNNARQTLRDRPEMLVRFEELFEQAKRVYPVREDNSFPTYQAPIGLIRYALLEIGHRLNDRGHLQRADDIMFLEIDEIRRSLAEPDDIASIVRRRRGEHAWMIANPGPATFGPDPGDPPDLRAVPADLRTLMTAILWFIENDLDTPAPAQGNGLRGVSASPGTWRGPARIIRSEAEFHKLQPGDVLVCPITSPVWSVLFSSVGALVTDTGGVLSHSAIIAREYGIPAVVATGNATSTLTNGQMVRVDGSRGTIEVE